MSVRRGASIGWLLVLLLTVALGAGHAGAQGQVYLRSVQPSSGRAGEELTLTLRGGGFGGARQVWVMIGDLQVLEAWVESDQVVGALVFIPEGAPPGPRTVEVVVLLGQNEEFGAVLEGGFSVLESEPLPTEPPGPELPRDEGDGLEWPWWLLIVGGAGVLLGGVALGVTVSLRVRKSALQKEWQSKAQDQDLPKTCQAGSHYARREKPELKPGRWKVAGLKVTLYHSASGRRGSTREVPPELVDRVDKAARHKLLRGESEELAQQSAEIGRELAALVTAWQSLSEIDHDVYLQAHLEGGEASVKFILYRCVGEPGRWKKISEWTAKLKAIDHLPSTFRGPRAGEPATAYRALLEEQFGGYVYGLIQEAGRLL